LEVFVSRDTAGLSVTAARGRINLDDDDDNEEDDDDTKKKKRKKKKTMSTVSVSVSQDPF